MRSLLNIVIIILSTVILGSAAIIGTLIIRSGTIFKRCARLWARILINWCGVELSTRTLCKPEEFVEPILFMSNHQSHYDIPAIYCSLPFSTMFLAKKELKRIPFLGWAMWVVGFVFIDRKNKEQAFRAIDEAASEFVAQKKSIVIFPEGTRSMDGGIGDFKKGGFHLAIQAKAKIIPIGIWGTLNVLPKGSWFVRSGKVCVHIGEPIDASRYSYESMNELIKEVRAAITDLTEMSRKALTNAVVPVPTNGSSRQTKS